jgi:hypothetical protein
MERERNEVYERIPWETLEPKGGDRQWWMFALAGAIVLGALAYSFMANRAVPVSTATSQAATATAPLSSASPPAALAPPVPEVSTPMLVTEADLMAVAPERLIERATAHAEWFVAEYVSVDGSEEGRRALASLMPAGIAIPEAPDGSRVFVEWVRAIAVEEIGAEEYRVEVLVRSLLADGDEPYRRQAPFTATVDIRIAESGPQVVMPPVLSAVTNPEPMPLALVPVPPDVEAAAIAASGASAVAGGVQTPTGEWRVVVTAPGPDGVPRPSTVLVPPSSP